MSIKQVDYMAVAEKVMKQMAEGAFLTVKSDDEMNTTIIGWATIGVVWQKPILMIAVRKSRHTFSILEQAEDFTVSVPLKNMKDKILCCGTKSGKDVNKYKKCKLATRKSQKVVSPVINVPGIHFECKIVFKNEMDPTYLVDEYRSIYPDKDYHVLYFGQILDCYEI